MRGYTARFSVMAGRAVCLILFAYRLHPQRPLVLAANRDEFYSRPALAADWWEAPFAGERHNTQPTGESNVAARIYGGRDLTAHGTWLAVSSVGRLAAVTNWTVQSAAPAAQSRGDLPSRFLAANVSAREFVDSIDGSRYAGFNLLAYDGMELVYTSNRSGEVRALEAGVYGLTNTRLGAGLDVDGQRRPSADLPPRWGAHEEWPKATFGAIALQKMAATASAADLIALLAQSLLPLETPADREDAPERSYSPAFIRGAEYGTRASTAVVVGDQSLEFAEQLYGPFGKPGGRTTISFPLRAPFGAAPARNRSIA